MAALSFGFSAEQDELRRTVRAFLAEKSPEAEVRRLMDTDDAFDALLLVAARTDTGVSLFAVDGTAGGVRRERLFTMDQTRKLANVELNGAPARLIGTDGDGWPAIEHAWRLGAIALAAEQ